MWLKHCPAEAYLNEWAKRWLNNKNTRKKNEFFCLVHFKLR